MTWIIVTLIMNHASYLITNPRLFLRRCKTKDEDNHGDAEYTENRRIEKGRGI
jgi:hypothetical protein